MQHVRKLQRSTLNELKETLSSRSLDSMRLNEIDTVLNWIHSSNRLKEHDWSRLINYLSHRIRQQSSSRNSSVLFLRQTQSSARFDPSMHSSPDPHTPLRILHTLSKLCPQAVDNELATLLTACMTPGTKYTSNEIVDLAEALSVTNQLDGLPLKLLDYHAGRMAASLSRSDATLVLRYLSDKGIFNRTLFMAVRDSILNESEQLDNDDLVNVAISLSQLKISEEAKKLWISLSDELAYRIASLSLNEISEVCNAMSRAGVLHERFWDVLNYHIAYEVFDEATVRAESTGGSPAFFKREIGPGAKWRRRGDGGLVAPTAGLDGTLRTAFKRRLNETLLLNQPKRRMKHMNKGDAGVKGWKSMGVASNADDKQLHDAHAEALRRTREARGGDLPSPIKLRRQPGVRSEAEGGMNGKVMSSILSAMSRLKYFPGSSIVAMSRHLTENFDIVVKDLDSMGDLIEMLACITQSGADVPDLPKLSSLFCSSLMGSSPSPANPRASISKLQGIAAKPLLLKDLTPRQIGKLSICLTQISNSLPSSFFSETLPPKLIKFSGRKSKVPPPPLPPSFFPREQRQFAPLANLPVRRLWEVPYAQLPSLALSTILHGPPAILLHDSASSKTFASHFAHRELLCHTLEICVQRIHGAALRSSGVSIERLEPSLVSPRLLPSFSWAETSASILGGRQEFIRTALPTANQNRRMLPSELAVSSSDHFAGRVLSFDTEAASIDGTDSFINSDGRLLVNVTNTLPDHLGESEPYHTTTSGLGRSHVKPIAARGGGEIEKPRTSGSSQQAFESPSPLEVKLFAGRRGGTVRQSLPSSQRVADRHLVGCLDASITSGDAANSSFSLPSPTSSSDPRGHQREEEATSLRIHQRSKSVVVDSIAIQGSPISSFSAAVELRGVSNGSRLQTVPRQVGDSLGSSNEALTEDNMLLRRSSARALATKILTCLTAFVHLSPPQTFVASREPGDSDEKNFPQQVKYRMVESAWEQNILGENERKFAANPIEDALRALPFSALCHAHDILLMSEHSFPFLEDADLHSKARRRRLLETAGRSGVSRSTVGGGDGEVIGGANVMRHSSSGRTDMDLKFMETERLMAAGGNEAAFDDESERGINNNFAVGGLVKRGGLRSVDLFEHPPSSSSMHSSVEQTLRSVRDKLIHWVMSREEISTLPPVKFRKDVLMSMTRRKRNQLKRKGQAVFNFEGINPDDVIAPEGFENVARINALIWDSVLRIAQSKSANGVFSPVTMAEIEAKLQNSIDISIPSIRALMDQQRMKLESYRGKDKTPRTYDDLVIEKRREAERMFKPHTIYRNNPALPPALSPSSLAPSLHDEISRVPSRLAASNMTDLSASYLPNHSNGNENSFPLAIGNHPLGTIQIISEVCAGPYFIDTVLVPTTPSTSYLAELTEVLPLDAWNGMTEPWRRSKLEDRSKNKWIPSERRESKVKTRKLMELKETDEEAEEWAAWQRNGGRYDDPFYLANAPIEELEARGLTLSEQQIKERAKQIKNEARLFNSHLISSEDKIQVVGLRHTELDEGIGERFAAAAAEIGVQDPWMVQNVSEKNETQKTNSRRLSKRNK